MLEHEVAEKYPLHYHVWRNDYLGLEELLLPKTYNIESVDPHGRTPLMLSVILDHLESARVLLRHNANACFKGKDFWSISQEAVSTGDIELVKLLITHRDSHMVRKQSMVITNLLHKLKESPDFYFEMKWEFTSWLPLVSLMCPSDVCRVWKQGSNVRIDATLIGFSKSSSWVRGNMSYIFRITDQGVLADEVNHTEQTIYRHSIGSLLAESASGVGGVAGATADSLLRAPSDDLINKKLTQPNFVTYLETNNLEFAKSKSGIWGWGSVKKESINGHQCQVFSVADVQAVTLRRTEHLNQEDLHEMQNISNKTSDPTAASNNPLTNLLGGQNFEKSRRIQVENEGINYNPDNIPLEVYFSHDPNQKPSNEIGRSKIMTAKMKTYKAHLWLCEDYPLSLNDQVLPVLELMAQYNPFYLKLKEFMDKRLPIGFPMRVELPLYHILNACVTFGNLFGGDLPAYGVSSQGSMKPPTENAGKPHPRSCLVEDCAFDIGRGYNLVEENSPGHFGSIDEEEQLIQMAVHRSLVEYGGADHLMQRQYSLAKRGVVEARAGEYIDPEEAMIQEAIAESFHQESGLSEQEKQYLKALELSREEIEQEEERKKREDEELDRILKLSLVDN